MFAIDKCWKVLTRLRSTIRVLVLLELSDISGFKVEQKITPQAQPRELVSKVTPILGAFISSPPDYYFACMTASLRKAYNPKHDHSATPQTCSLCHPTFQAPDSIAPSSVFCKSTWQTPGKGIYALSESSMAIRCETTDWKMHNVWHET
jgi:hypothetical protein